MNRYMTMHGRKILVHLPSMPIKEFKRSDLATAEDYVKTKCRQLGIPLRSSKTNEVLPSRVYPIPSGKGFRAEAGNLSQIFHIKDHLSRADTIKAAYNWTLMNEAKR